MRLLFPILLVGCGQLIGIDTNKPLDAGVPDVADAPVVKTGPCASTDPFGPVQWMLDLATVRAETSAVLTTDERNIFFLSDRENPNQWNYEIFAATRVTTDAPWENIHLVKELADYTQQFSGLSISPDGLDIYYSRSNFPTSKRAVYHARRSDLGAKFGTPEEILDHPDFEFDISMAPSKNLYMAIGNSSGRYNLWFAEASGSMTWLPATPIVLLLNPKEQRFAPAISPDELELFFSTQDSATGQIQVARRAKKDDLFDTPVPVTELDLNNMGEAASWVSPDKCRLYMATLTRDLKLFDQGRYWWDLAVVSRR